MPPKGNTTNFSYLFYVKTEVKILLEYIGNETVKTLEVYRVTNFKHTNNIYNWLDTVTTPFRKQVWGINYKEKRPYFYFFCIIPELENSGVMMPNLEPNLSGLSGLCGVYLHFV
uniref:Uncharacterized protein n=1 Tax=Glossina pallidipes TaxID=7398 RepID=A0A1B0AG27_GLOPL